MSKKSRTALLVAIILIALAAAAYALMSGTAAKALQLRRLDSQAARWRAANLNSYEMTLSIGCFCPFYDRMPLTIQVRDGQVVSVVDSQGRPVPADDPIRMYGNEQLMTVDGVFDYAREAIQTADQTAITYDAGMGFPLTLSIDQIKMAVDDELSVTIGDVKALE